MAEISKDHEAVNTPAHELELTADNAASRFVFVPAETFHAEGIGGWIARCDRNRCLKQEHRPTRACPLIPVP
eukprot:7376562-Prymnesium_polylepis.1